MLFFSGAAAAKQISSSGVNVKLASKGWAASNYGRRWLTLLIPFFPPVESGVSGNV